MGTTPTALADRPELYDDLEPVARAFSLLSSCRPMIAGFGGVVPAAIPLAEILAYCQMFAVEDRDEFVRLIHAMDDAYQMHLAKKRRDRTTTAVNPSIEPRSS